MKYLGAFLLGALCMWLAQQIWAPAPVPPRQVSAPSARTATAQSALPASQPLARSAADKKPPPPADSNTEAPGKFEAQSGTRGRPDMGILPGYDGSGIQPPASQGIESNPDNDLPLVERLNDIPPMDTPIPVAMSDAHRAVAERTDTIAELHSALESEPEDVSWAYEMQNYIQAFLLQSEPMQDFGSATVTCRTALCEIQAIGYAPGSGGQTQWSVVMGQMRLQAWFRNFAKSHGYSSGNGEQTVIFTFLERNPSTLDNTQ